MPLIKIDYNEKLLDKENIGILIRDLHKEAMRIYNCDQDHITIVTSPFGDYSFSTAAMEIEVRANIARYKNLDKDMYELRSSHIKEFSGFLRGVAEVYNIDKNIVFTITFEDWQVEWLEGATKKSST